MYIICTLIGIIVGFTTLLVPYTTIMVKNKTRRIFSALFTTAKRKEIEKNSSFRTVVVVVFEEAGTKLEKSILMVGCC